MTRTDFWYRCFNHYYNNVVFQSVAVGQLILLIAWLAGCVGVWGRWHKTAAKISDITKADNVADDDCDDDDDDDDAGLAAEAGGSKDRH